MYEEDLALNNLQLLVCRNTQPNLYIYIYIYIGLDENNFIILI